MGGIGRDRDMDLRIHVLEVDGGGCGAVPKGQDREDRFDGARPAEQVAGHRLRTGHQRLIGIRPQGPSNGHGLGDVPLRGGRGVRVHVVNIGSRYTCVRESRGHRAGGATALGIGLGNVMTVGRHACPAIHAVNAGSASLSMIARLQHHDAGSLAHDEAITIGVVRTRGCGGVVVSS